ncbi:hypothetical protein AVEN_216573-1 [Araneus ventricosus]|uniref:Uncharacterized protein n=1 Tax=Araneus ventricosus TaxID=182803 RepID=A0A4Y2FZH7_ARAVE|nr:hypothetical protein AVEN_216573-1 [Araneus ventricosus]
MALESAGRNSLPDSGTQSSGRDGTVCPTVGHSLPDGTAQSARQWDTVCQRVGHSLPDSGSQFARQRSTVSQTGIRPAVRGERV